MQKTERNNKNMSDTNGDTFLRLVKIMDELREQCPWDRKQTIQSLRQMTIEETYELADAITDEDWTGIKEELGDMLLHIVFYAKIGSEQKKFELDEVINGICEKLISRHPHIYSDVKVNDAEDVKLCGYRRRQNRWVLNGIIRNRFGKK